MQKILSVKNFDSPSEAQLRYLTAGTIFFDIETTGLSSDRCSIYLISYGALAKLNEDSCTLDITMLFSDKGTVEDEALVISGFFDDIKDADRLISYNGLSFDERFIRGRCRRLNIDDSPLNIQHTDLYKILYPYADILGLTDRRLQTVESYLNTGRRDQKSGGDLIKVYKEYLKYPTDDALKALLLHNEDDVAGLIHVSSLCAVDALFNGGFTITDADVDDGCMVYSLSLAEELPRLITVHKPPLSLYARESRALLKIALYTGELKHYFKDYKNYIYLPDDDTAVHKDVEFMYIDKPRQKAKKDTAYIRLTDTYIPAFVAPSEDALDFYEDLKSKQMYMPLSRNISPGSESIFGYCMAALEQML